MRLLGLLLGVKTWAIAAFCLIAILAVALRTHADDAAATAAPAKKFAPPEGLVRLNPDAEVWIDKEKKEVVVDGQVALQEGQLEMFACPKGSKEHESVVSVNSKAYLIHAALLAVGAKQGQPVQFDPEYKPASGAEVAIEVQWHDADGKLQKTDARQWVQNVKTKQPLGTNWVFAGSGFWKDDFDDTVHYLAEAGDLVCVSNFPSATLDLPIESSQANEGLLFQSFKERVPPRGTPVRLIFRPKVEANAQPAEAPAATKPTS